MEGPLILDRYRPLGLLGEGGFASVELAWDTRMQRRVAIKRLLLPLDSSGNPQQPPGLAEARTAAMLSHPAIVTVFDFDTDADEAFLVMEFVDGTSLADLMAEVGEPLTLDETAAIVEGVAGALTFAHDNGVLHLDIKPENVLITRDGRVKVADFGISTLSHASGHEAAFGGTLGYMPPEQLTGAPVSHRTDGWAFAALVFEALTGDNPYIQPNIGAALQVAQAEPPSLGDYSPDLPEALDDVLFAELSAEPSERYTAITAFAAALLEQMGDPALGRESLAELVDDAVEDEFADDDYGLDEVGLWDRAAGLRMGPWLIRLAAAIEAGWMGWLGLTGLRIQSPALYGGIALAALAGMLAPSLGVGLGVALLAGGVWASGAWPAALALTCGGILWWWFIARHNDGAAVLPLSAPALGVARVGYAQPLLAGFSLEPIAAAVTGLLGGVLVMLASASTLQGPPYVAVEATAALDPTGAGVAAQSFSTLMGSPSTYVALLGWPLAAAAMSLACRRATRTGAVVGTVGGCIALGGSAILAGRVAALGGQAQVAARWSSATLAWPLGASFILMLVVIALGAPLRGEEE